MKQDDDALPEHKREGWAKRMADEADMRRKAAKEEALLASAEKWAIDTGWKPMEERK